MSAAKQPQNGPSEEEIEELAYQFWEERGRPIGSPEVDWARAEQALAARSDR